MWLAGLPALRGRTLEADKHCGGDPPAICAGLNRVHTARAGEYTKDDLSAMELRRTAPELFFRACAESIPENPPGFVNKMEILRLFRAVPLERREEFLYNATMPGLARFMLKHNERTE